MSQQQQQVAPESAGDISEFEVAAFLREHPDFFERHRELLEALRLPHAASGSTVSLVERQVALLRDSKERLQKNLREFVELARQNDELVSRIHALGMAFLQARTLAGRVDVLERSLREEFAAERATLVLFDTLAGRVEPSGFVLVRSEDSADLAPFSTFLKQDRTRCGPLRERQRTFLFADDHESLGSAAMIPIQADRRIGFLVIANRDRDYFNPGERADFLDRMGALIGAALSVQPEARA